MGSISYAAPICSGKITQLRTWQNGSEWVGVNNGYGMWLICKINQDYGGVSAEMCKATYSMLLTAASSGKSVSLQFNADANYPDCNTLPRWSGTTSSLLGMTYINY